MPPHQNDRRNRILAIAAMLIVAGVGIFFAIKAIIRPDYYREGLKVTQLIGKMINSEEYTNVSGSMSQDMMDYIQTIRQIDYSSPSAVYSLQITDHDRFIRKAILNDSPESLQQWDNLSAEIREVLINNYSIGTYFNMYTARMGSSVYVVSSMYRVNYTSDSLRNSETKDYLYVYGGNYAILVSFRSGGATGQLFNITALPESALSDKQLFEEIGIKIKQIK